LQLDGAPDLAGHAKGFVGGGEFGAIHAALGHPGLHLFQRVQALFLVEDGVEDFGVDFFIQTDGLQREEDALQRLKGIGKAHVHAAHHHILRLGGGPFVKDRLEVAAVGAAVGEEFDDFHFASGRIHRSGGIDDEVVLAFLGREGLALREGGGQRGQRGGSCGSEREITAFHGLFFLFWAG